MRFPQTSQSMFIINSCRSERIQHTCTNIMNILAAVDT